MATVTGGGQTTLIDAGSNDRNGVAQALANAITAGLENGSLTRTTDGNNPPAGAGVLTISARNVTVGSPPAVSVDLINGGGSLPGSFVNLTGSGLPNQVVIGDGQDITYFTNGGGGSVVLGDGANVVGTPTIGGGNLDVKTGSGSDTINAYSGNVTVSPGEGFSNLVNTGLRGTHSNVLIFAAANVMVFPNGGGTFIGGDRVISTGGTGTDVVIGKANYISEATKDLVYNGDGMPVTVSVTGGQGSHTVFAGLGGGVISGGAAGNNVLLGGTGFRQTTLFGGGSGDVLFARGSSPSFLIASTGNETLSGGLTTAGNIFAAGLGGNTTIGGGSGKDTIYAGNPGTTTAFGGNIVIDGGLGNDIISFTNRAAGVTATVLINNFKSGPAENDQIQLIGFGADQQAAITQAASSAGTATLQDGTRITFGTAVNLNSTNFA